MIYGQVISRKTDEPLNCGYTLSELIELVADWRNNAEAIGSDLYDMTGDLAIGPKIVEDLVNHIKELESKLASQNS